MDYKDDMHDLKQMIKPKVPFSVSTVQRKMFWGYNRARNTIDFARDKGHAEIVKGYQGIGGMYQFI